MRYQGVADSRSKKTGEFVTSCAAVLYVCVYNIPLRLFGQPMLFLKNKA